MKIKIVFFSWNSFYGKLIRFGTKCKWTHIGIVGEEKTDGYYVYEALNNGLVKNFYFKEDIEIHTSNNNVIIEEIDLLCDCSRLKEACESYLGKPYDWLSIFNIATYILFGRYALKIKGSRYLICSEFVARVLYDIGYNLSELLNKPYDYITPADIYKHITGKDSLVNMDTVKEMVKEYNKQNG